jgi:hypothetical protein
LPSKTLVFDKEKDSGILKAIEEYWMLIFFKKTYFLKKELRKLQVEFLPVFIFLKLP